MNRSTLFCLSLAAALHAAVLFGVSGPAVPGEVKPEPDEWVEVALYSPPPAPVPAVPIPVVVEEPPGPPQAPPERAAEEAPAPPVPEDPPPEPQPPPDKPEPQPPLPLPDKPEPPPPPAPVRIPAPRKPETPPRPPARPAPKAEPARPARVPAARTAPQQGRPAATSAGGGYQSVGSVQYVRRGRASYPAEALRRKQSGTAMLMLYINESGRVDKVEVVSSSGFPALDRAAAAAEKKSVFRPVSANGKPVKVRARVPYTFRLE